jgi:hypothetical protein
MLCGPAKTIDTKVNCKNLGTFEYRTVPQGGDNTQTRPATSCKIYDGTIVVDTWFGAVAPIVSYLQHEHIRILMRAIAPISVHL